MALSNVSKVLKEGICGCAESASFQTSVKKILANYRSLPRAITLLENFRSVPMEIVMPINHNNWFSWKMTLNLVFCLW
jgi:hypothetical protein